MGVSIGTALGGLPLIFRTYDGLLQEQMRGVNPYAMPGFLPNMAAGWASMRAGARGPIACATTACAAGAQAIGDASSGAKSAQEAMDSLCAEQEKVLERLERAGVMGDMGPKLAEEHDLEYWNKDAVAKGNLAPQLKIENEKEKPLTVNYDELVKSWQK